MQLWSENNCAEIFDKMLNTKNDDLLARRDNIREGYRTPRAKRINTHRGTGRQRHLTDKRLLREATI